MTATEDPLAEQMAVQRRILLSFGATVLMSGILCTIYIAQKTRVLAAPETRSAQAGMRVKPANAWLNAPNPPAPLPDAASPYQTQMTQVAHVAPTSPLKLDMLATQDAWVEVATDGHLIYAKLVRANQTLSFEAFERIRMVTGNAMGLELRFNGKPVAAVDAKGRVRALEFTAGGSRDLKSIQNVSKS